MRLGLGLGLERPSGGSVPDGTYYFDDAKTMPYVVDDTKTTYYTVED